MKLTHQYNNINFLGSMPDKLVNLCCLNAYLAVISKVIVQF